MLHRLLASLRAWQSRRRCPLRLVLDPTKTAQPHATRHRLILGGRVVDLLGSPGTSSKGHGS